MNKQVHIVCPEIPHPSSTADMTDTYFQLHFLQRAGYQVILHCFHDDTNPVSTHLNQLVSGIHLYARNHGHKGVSIRHPYCISSRSNPALLENLLQQVHPVLFQGMSCTYYLPHLAAHGYKTVVRINGIASQLYETLTRCEKSLIKKAYSFNEARLIRKWEEKIAGLATVIATTPGDQQKFQQLYKTARTVCLPPFIPVPEIKTQTGTGMYCLYYGDLSNPENDKMVQWLSENVFSKLPVPLIVADTCSVVRIEYQHGPESNICMVCNPAETALCELLQKAQIILLPRCHDNGFDKRLLQALEKGRHCICNDLMVKDTGLEKLFITANGCEENIRAISDYFSQPFTEDDIRKRAALLANCYSPARALQGLLEIIDP
ncbi:MAG: hypothetical protein ABI813_15215 [Bacteroidota bacterium]